MIWSLFKNKSSEGSLEPYLCPHDGVPSILILSGACCNPMSVMLDEELKKKVQLVLQELGMTATITTISVTDAQAHTKSLSAMHKVLIDKIQSIFFSQGLAGFPALIVNGDLLLYGGVPEKDRLTNVIMQFRNVNQAASAAAQ